MGYEYLVDVTGRRPAADAPCEARERSAFATRAAATTVSGGARRATCTVLRSEDPHVISGANAPLVEELRRAARRSEPPRTDGTS